MANLLILEGLSRTGKSSITKILSEKYGFKSLSIKEKMPESIDLPAFYHGIHTISNEFYSVFKDETFIIDRSFLSELVYSKFFNRETHLNNSSIISDLLLNNNFILVLFYNNYQEYQNRIPKDRIVYTEEEFTNQKDLFDWYFHLYRDNNDSEKWKSRFIEIDTTQNTIEDSIEKIEKNLKEKFNIEIK